MAQRHGPPDYLLAHLPTYEKLPSDESSVIDSTVEETHFFVADSMVGATEAAEIQSLLTHKMSPNDRLNAHSLDESFTNTVSSFINKNRTKRGRIKLIVNNKRMTEKLTNTCDYF